MAHSVSTVTAGRPAANKKRDARELLLNAATDLFASHGIAGTTFAMIAKRAGLTPAMVHYYFKDRERLLDAVVDERFMRFVAHVWEPVRLEADALEMIRRIVERALDGIEKMPWVPSTWVREVLNEGGLLRERMLRRLPFEKARLLGRAIARGQVDGSLNPEVDPMLAVSSTIGLVMLHMATIKTWAKAFHREPLSKRALQRHITGLLLDGLRHKGTANSEILSLKKNR
jgi:AcrR family transcriptional regulator